MRSLYDDNIKKFNLWCRDNTSKVINIVFRPYDNLVILNDLIDDYLLKNKKILYIKKFFDVFKFKYNEGVEYITFDTLYSINKFYDLIILDDVSFYSEKRDIEIIEYISFLMKRCSKIILCSFEYILKKEASINLAGINNKKYFLEPRIIKSRLNFLNSMPKILYDYFQWFIKERRNVIIYTPNEIYTSSIFNYYIYVFGASKNINIIKDSGFILNNIINKEKINIIITHNSMSNIDNIKEFDLIFYFCDEKIFDSKKIIFSCAKLNSDKLVREVLLLCQKETYNVSQAKKIARSYNQIICQEEI
ncbi:Uncharacterised protein [Sarcina ventriculi]|uniref:hypothetical protein n=1 Tax=Sarcina ventriculi TaxID=1267 RepID=UPI000D9FB2EC|nr:hypothetical protein [Sarcina ventriculi]MDO4401654.1 hypothetical protein [Clostridiaceae bacterium]SPZ50532.1 Uncharacterised protein [Sarcina ventriculi]